MGLALIECHFEFCITFVFVHNFLAVQKMCEEHSCFPLSCQLSVSHCTIKKSAPTEVSGLTIADNISVQKVWLNVYMWLNVFAQCRKNT